MTEAGFQQAQPADLAPRMHTNFRPSNIGTDPLAHIPPGARERLRALRDHVSDLHALGISFEDRREATTARLQAEARLRQLRGHAQDGGFNLPPSNHSVIDAEAQLAKLSDDEQRLNKRYETRSAAWHAASQVLGAVEAYLRDAIPGNVVLEDFEAPEPKLNKGEDILGGLDRLRRRVRELKADLHRIRSAPFPSSYTKRKMREQVEALAERGAPSVSLLIEHDGKIEFPTQRLTAKVFEAERSSLAFAEPVDALALLCWVDPQAVMKKLDASIEAESDDAAALTHEARQKGEAELLGDLLDIERQEVALVWRARREGFSGIEHRVDCSPLALLGLQLVTAPRAAALPATSPGLVIEAIEPGWR